MMAPDLPEILIHTLLRGMGGTSAIARALHAVIPHSVYSFECDDGLCEDGQGAVSPEDLGRYAKQENIGLVHLHATQDWESCLEGLIRAGIPSVITLHDCRALTGGCPYPLQCKAWEDGCLPECPRLYPASDQVARGRRSLLRELGPTIVAPSRWMVVMARAILPELDVRVIPNGVPWPETLPLRSEARQAVGVAPGARMVLFVAHGGVEAVFKQGEYFLKAFKQIKARVPEAICYVVGGKRMERHGDVVLWPYADSQTMARIMRAADVLAYPTLADNHPLVVLEAMSMALPVVAFASGGVPEQIARPGAGVLVPPGRWGLLQQEIVRLLERPVQARRLGETARIWGGDRFRQERMVSDYLKLYSRLTRI
ncbi:glycosyltransferase [Desulfovibrio ferrophilus]|uniref:Glycosyl transferase group 1 n=1 Tax=Desulfovibrio ferrophilus TaxID=241368 RepID=A0A2Z6AX47_9BACT|nr:glycosyltransferase [Desulfovibrio ferrophilus]BBD07827.1 glycosyl transferase group 1 [Desulfovibrio ferrophilus]